MKGYRLSRVVSNLGLLVILINGLNFKMPGFAFAYHHQAKSEFGSFGGLAIGVPNERDDFSGGVIVNPARIRILTRSTS